MTPSSSSATRPAPAAALSGAALTPEQFDRLAAEHAAKQARIVDLLERHRADAVVLSSPAALGWFLGGARTHVSLAGAPIARALVHHGGTELGVFANESERLRAEELGGTEGVTVHDVEWHGSLDDVAGWFPAAAGWTLLDEADVEAELRAARSPLLPGEVERYRGLCEETAIVLTDVLTATTAETTEREVAAELAAGLIGIGADPVVLLVSGEQRAAHRHPLPTAAPLGRRAMAVVCARRDGLIANATRWVAFGEPVEGEEEADAAILEVEREILDALRPGDPLTGMLPLIQGSYPRHGFAEDEWTRHHQGGVAGYDGRDPRLSPGLPDAIVADQAFAWNPSASGPDGVTAKVEDTVLLTLRDGEPYVDVLSVDPRWPAVEVGGRLRPAVLRR
ncbi:M24 family metallopeptidase [Zhihengliuella sp.]|uniref:M24 family metallopeptidase n=1 Tax=Zhihengliuella sp. TaxID=1954483 RepID=UPI0028128B2A|nr:M24 family metallopeptidase [Zhihengliuella sp.]